ncbi:MULTISPECIES: VWA domain-containing protein [unclassified Streptomyces]|uniref:vWA domain-containing protein n=1 Tax=unclassified Streptomyces TaxID=2593676 RepID=UPI0035DB7BFE
MCAAVLTAGFLAVSPVTAAHSAPADRSPTRAEIYRALDLDQEPADYVILVDTSGSMKHDGRYNTVRSRLRSFLDDLTPKDHVALLTFDSRPEVRYIGAAGNTAAIVSKLPSAPNPAGDTDMGAALNAALTELERDDASPVASVVLVTDGEHHPPAGSRYPTTTGPAWSALHRRAQAVARHAELAGYALPLGSGATGVDLFGKVVQNTTVLRPQNIQGFGAYLARAGERTRARKAALLLAKDAGKGVTATWSDDGRIDLTDGSATAGLTLRSTTRHLPLTVTGLRAFLVDPALTVDGLPDRVTLQPGASRTYRVRLRGRPAAGPLPYRRTENAEATLRMTGRVGSSWEKPLASDIRLAPSRAIRVERAAVPLRATVGSAVLLPVAAGTVVLVVLAALLRWRRVNRPPLRGVLVLAPAFGEKMPDHIALDGRAVAFRPMSMGGRGRVHGRRRSTDGGTRIELRIRYTPDGSAARESGATCRAGGRVVVNGVAFTYLPEPDRAPSAGRPR